VTISGNKLNGATSVTFGGVAAVFTQISSSTIIATTPPHAAGVVDIVVRTSLGPGVGASLFTYEAAPPTVTSVSPNTGTTRGGTTVTISGTNFTGATAVTFGGTPATSFTVNSATSITAVTPAHAQGAGDVQVTTPAGTGNGSGLFTYVAVRPTVISVAPNSGPTSGGTSVTITGTNFLGATVVTFGGGAASNVVVVNDTTITAVTPPFGGPNKVDVSVTTPEGTGTGAQLFTYVAAPTVSSVTPNSGPTGGGTSVTITGSNFTGTTAVLFGGSPAAFTVTS
jgi:hypothetical protein